MGSTKNKQSKPAICLDLDDCVLNFMEVLIEMHNKNNNTNVQLTDFKEWSLPSPVLKTFLENEEKIYSLLKPKPKVIEAINEIKALGYKVLFLTARKKKFKKVTEDNLKENNIEYDAIYFNKKKSLKINKLVDEYLVRVFVDDKYSTVKEVSENTNVPEVCLMDMPSNKKENSNSLIRRIKNLKQILKKLPKISRGKK